MTLSQLIPRRATAVVPWLLCLAVIVVLLPAGGWSSPCVAVALALQLGVGALLVWGPKQPTRHGPAVLGIAAYMLSIALLREGVGATAGFGPLVLLPVMWSALAGRRPELAFSVAGLIVVGAAPMLLVGPPQYPSSGWRGAAFMLVTALSTGPTIVGLVERLRASVRRSEAVLDTMSEGLALTRNGQIVAVNRALCRITGFAEADLVGARPPFPFWPPELHGDTEALRRRVVADGGGEFELELQTADGRRFPASITAAATDLGDGSRAFLNTVRDITERRRHEDALRDHADQLAAIAAVARAVGHSDPLDARRTICRTALDVTSAAHAVSIWESAPDGSLTTTATRPEIDPPHRIAPAETDHGVHVVLRTRAPLFVADARTSPHCDRRIIERIGAASVLFHPIADADGVRGVLAISWPAPISEPSAQERLIVGVLADEAAVAMQRADLLARLDELTRTDELTGLPNRRAWDELLAHELAAARRHGQPLAVAMLDLDHFKAYNDQRGHLAGDRLLRAAAASWQQHLRSTDVLARWGGEEFALLLPGCSADQATALIERLRGTLPDDVTFSAGVSAGDGTTAPRTLVDAADQALYHAKSSGRDRVSVAA
jgi:diguanylate cyclase (GGDEF)-like protein/PAS domain S-box-containing protein